MDFFIIVLVGVMCMYVGVKILSSEEQNKVFNKYHLEVKDVKKYNQFCGWLAIGFGVVATLTLYIGSLMRSWVSSLFTLALIGEAAIVLYIYRKGEQKMAVNWKPVYRKKKKNKKAENTEESKAENQAENKV